MAATYKLYYFQLAGLGEPARYLMLYGGIPFEDVRITAKDWPEYKKRMPFATVPVLEVGGVMYPQSRAICRFLGARVGLAGTSPEEDLNIDAIVDAFNDLRADWFYDDNVERKASKLDPLLNTIMPYYLAKFEAIVEAGAGYLANGKLSWADIYFAAPITWFNAMLQRDVLNGYPGLQGLRRTVNALPRIASYVSGREGAEKLCPRFIARDS